VTSLFPGLLASLVLLSACTGGDGEVELGTFGVPMTHPQFPAGEEEEGATRTVYTIVEFEFGDTSHVWASDSEPWHKAESSLLDGRYYGMSGDTHPLESTQGALRLIFKDYTGGLTPPSSFEGGNYGDPVSMFINYPQGTPQWHTGFCPEPDLVFEVEGSNELVFWGRIEATLCEMGSPSNTRSMSARFSSTQHLPYL